ncbi:MAG: FAD-dependent oxidoreductase [Sandaracinaceae bacterium]|nr:FAD-dependent oxidoreductase [Sandaracinaceae bacterium]
MKRVSSMRRVVELVEASDLSKRVRRFVFRSVDEKPIDFIAGQWMKLYLAPGIERDYSIASPPPPPGIQSNSFELAVARVDGGQGTEILFSLEPGARIECLGPNGLFIRDERHRNLPAVYVGTGTGIAPLRSMILDELRSPQPTEQWLLFGARSEEDLLYHNEFEELAKSTPHFHYLPTLSQGSPAWQGRRGYVQNHLEEIRERAGEAHYYICGLSQMVEEVRNKLKSMGVERRFIHTERYD